MKEGLKTYFEKYREKNAELEDFVKELSAAAKKVGAVKDEQFMIDWTDQWLKSAGCALLELDFTQTNGKLDSVQIKQTPYNQNNTPENRLRDQKFVLALLDKDMKIIKEVTVQTSDKHSVTDVTELKGIDTPVAFFMNLGAHGYGKFTSDEMSMTAFEQNLYKIEDRLTRRQLYLTLFDMIKQQGVSGSRVMHIIMNNLEHETAEEILSQVLNSIVPTIIGKYLPIQNYKEVNSKMFATCRSLLASGRFVV